MDFFLGHSTHLRVAVAKVISFASKNPITKKNGVDAGKTFSTYNKSLRSIRTKMKPQVSWEVSV